MDKKITIASLLNYDSSPRFLDLPAEVQDLIISNVSKVVYAKVGKYVIDPKTYHLVRKRVLNVALVSKALRKMSLFHFYDSVMIRGTAELNTSELGWKHCSSAIGERPRGDGQYWYEKAYDRSGSPSSRDADGLLLPTPNKRIIFYDIQPNIVRWMELPPYSVRTHVRHLVLMLTVPREPFLTRDDWLYPVQHLTDMGFNNLVSLRLEIKARKFSYMGPGLGTPTVTVASTGAVVKFLDEQTECHEQIESLNVTKLVMLDDSAA